MGTSPPPSPPVLVHRRDCCRYFAHHIFDTLSACSRQPSASHSTLLPWRYLKPGECVRGFRASPSNNRSKPQAAAQQWSTRAPARIGEHKLTTVRTTADVELLPGSASLLTISVANRQHCSAVGCCYCNAVFLLRQKGICVRTLTGQLFYLPA